MTTGAERVERRHAARRRVRRQRSAAALAGIALLAAGAVVWFLTRKPEHAAAPPPPPPPPPVRYGGSKLLPRAKPRRGALPTEEEQVRAVRRLAELGLPILCGGKRGRYIALTFDDGPGPYTETALRILRRRNMRATFFLVGSRVEFFPSLPRREATLGALGNHTWSHAYLPKLRTASIRREIRSTLEIIQRTSEAPILLFRPPYGAHNPRVDRIVRSFGLLQILWSIDSGDSTGATVKGVYRNVISNLKPGAIILMHENRATTIKSLTRYVLPAIQKRRLKPVTVPELLALDPPSASQVRRRRC